MPKGIYKRTLKGRKNLSISHMGQVPWNKGLKGFLEAEKHYSWKGNNGGYNTVHDWVKRRLQKPKLCQFCGKKRTLQMASKSHGFKRDLDDWIFLCISCHHKYDDTTKDRTRDSKGRFL